MGCRASSPDGRRRARAQSVTEFFMTYGWAILIVAVALAALFELGVFNGSNLAPQACIAQSGFVCMDPLYTTNGISFTLGQTTGQIFYDAYAFVASDGSALNATGIPVNLTLLAAYHMGTLTPGETKVVNFADLKAGGFATPVPIGTPIAGYVWLVYSKNPGGPSNYEKVATLTARNSGASRFPASNGTGTILASALYNNATYDGVTSSWLIFSTSPPLPQIPSTNTSTTFLINFSQSWPCCPGVSGWINNYTSDSNSYYGGYSDGPIPIAYLATISSYPEYIVNLDELSNSGYMKNLVVNLTTSNTIERWYPVSHNTYQADFNGRIATPINPLTGVPLIEVNVSPSNATISSGQELTISASVAGGIAPYAYSWYVNGNPIGVNSSTLKFYGNSTTLSRSPDSVSVHVVDNAGSTASAAVVVKIGPQVTPTAYVPITISTTSGSGPTPSGFQQLLMIRSASYGGANGINNGWSNVEFSTGPGDTGSPLYAWVLANASNTATLTPVWVNLGSTVVPGNGGTATIYMNFMPSNVMLSKNSYTGEAPFISTPYAAYDNGGHVFSFYQAFGGLSHLPSGWETSKQYYGVDYTPLVFNPTSMTIIGNTTSTNLSGILNTAPPLNALPVATDWMESISTGSTFFFNAQGLFGFGSCVTFGVDYNGGQVTLNIENNQTSSVAYPSGPTIYSLVNTNDASPTGSGPEYLQMNYSTVITASLPQNQDLQYCSSPQLSLQINDPAFFSADLYFWDERLMPANGGMPRYSFGNVV